MKHCRMKRLLSLLFFFLLAAGLSGADLSIRDVTVTPRWPWNGKVDITYYVDAGPTVDLLPKVSGRDLVRNMEIPMPTIMGDGVGTPVTNGGPYHIVWDAGKDAPANFNTTEFVVTLTADYLVFNLLNGKIKYQNNGPDLSDDTCRTTELWLRWIPAGTFTMGSPEDELGRSDNETQHQVTLTQGYWIGVFEVTQKQYELITGGNPSYYKGDTRPVEQVSYEDIRGTDAGAGWPSGGHAVDVGSFLGKLRAKTGLEFDLPTEAQWEYACRAGTTTALNSGKDLTNKGECPNMAEVGRYQRNRSDGKGGSQHTNVGCYLPNAWGLYDMHGNVIECCLDMYGDYPSEAVIDPQGPEAGSYRVRRGGYWNLNAQDCRSALHTYGSPSARSYYVGFRLVCPP